MHFSIANVVLTEGGQTVQYVPYVGQKLMIMSRHVKVTREKKTGFDQMFEKLAKTMKGYYKLCIQ